MSVGNNGKSKVTPKTTKYKHNDSSKKIVISTLIVILSILLIMFIVQLYKVLNPNQNSGKTNVEKAEVTTQNSEKEDNSTKEKNNKEEIKEEENKEENIKKDNDNETNAPVQNTVENIVYIKNIGDEVIKSENGDILVTNLEFIQADTDRYIIRGVVENKSPNTVYSVVPLLINYYDENGEETNRDAIEIVNTNGIMPNEKMQFSGVSTMNKIEASYKAEIYWDYETQTSSSKIKSISSSGDTVQSVDGDIVVENLSITQRKEGFNDVKGTVTNKSKNKVYSLVQMQIKYYDKNGKILSTEVCYIVDYNGVKPNETVEFSAFGYPFGTFASYEVEIIEGYRTE